MADVSESAAKAKRTVVIKIGSSTLTRADGTIDEDYLAGVAAQLAAVRAAGWQPIMVSSGAIACGVRRLGFDARPDDLPSLQAAASVGQVEFAGAWAKALRAAGMEASLVLLTRRDTADRTSYLHARDTIERLLDLGVCPIINENDTVSVEQIRFGDNDTLAALVACLVKADLCIIMSDIDGLYTDNPAKNPDARLIERVEKIDKDILAVAGEAGSAVGSGGMVTKIRAARTLGIAGIPLVVCSGKQENAIVNATSGKHVGTIFVPSKRAHEITPRKLWIALGDAARGALVVDDGAKRALVERGSSLLCVGVRRVEGSFEADDVVDIKDESGYLFARGFVTADRDIVELALGKSHDEMARNRILADLSDRALVHRDNLVIFE